MEMVKAIELTLGLGLSRAVFKGGAGGGGGGGGGWFEEKYTLPLKGVDHF